MYKIGLLGAGFMGGMHNAGYVALSRDHDVTVAAIADKRPDKLNALAEYWPDAKLYDEGKELIENEALDAVDICLPTYMHAEFSKLVMEKGLDLFLEKPVCIKEEDADELLEVQKRTGANVMVGQVLRSWPEYIYLKEAVDSGRFGKLTSLVMYRLNGRDRSVDAGWNNWYRNPKYSGSAIVDLHIHDIDCARWLLGEPKGFELTARRSSDEFFEHVAAIYDYGSTLVTAEAVWDYTFGVSFEMSYRAGFEKASIFYNSTQSPALRVFEEGKEVCTPELWGDESDDIKQISGYYKELQYFVEQRIMGKPIELCTLENGVKTYKQAMAEYRYALGK